MKRSKVIQVRVTPEQKQKVFIAMQDAGCKTMSNFVRKAMLSYGLEEKNMLKKIYNQIIDNKKNKKMETIKNGAS